jgi:hypothetical protein
VRHNNIPAGSRFGRWQVSGPHAERSGAGQRYQMCRCRCGTTKPVRSDSLRSGASRSCGCLREELLRHPRPGKPWSAARRAAYNLLEETSSSRSRPGIRIRRVAGDRPSPTINPTNLKQPKGMEKAKMTAYWIDGGLSAVERERVRKEDAEAKYKAELEAKLPTPPPPPPTVSIRKAN